MSGAAVGDVKFFVIGGKADAVGLEKFVGDFFDFGGEGIDTIDGFFELKLA